MTKIFLSFLPPAPLQAGGRKGKKHHRVSKKRRLRRQNVCEELSICFPRVILALKARLRFRGFIRKPRKKKIRPILLILSKNIFDLCLDNYEPISNTA
jgi:hypothetical protein